jgi:hypothetical protein
MPRFMITVPHDEDHDACVRALHAIEQYGSHLMTHAEWGCKDGHHACWLIVDMNDRGDAVRMVPPEFRTHAQVVELNRFTRDEIAAMVAEL